MIEATTSKDAAGRLAEVAYAVHHGFLPGIWHIPHTVVKLPDGSTLIRPGKAVLWMKIKDASKATGVEAKTLNRLAECGQLTRQRPSPNQSWFMPGEVFEFLEKTRGPEFWNRVRRQAFLRGETLEDARVLGKESGL
jgi:hypothetical protein